MTFELVEEKLFPVQEESRSRGSEVMAVCPCGLNEESSLAGGCIGQISQGRKASFALEAELGCRGRGMTLKERSTGRLD